MRASWVLAIGMGVFGSMAACGSDGDGGDAGEPDAGSDASSTGGTAPEASPPETGGGGTSGSGGAAPEAAPPEAGPVEAGEPEAGPEAGKHPLQGLQAYPPVPYPDDNPYDPDDEHDAAKAMLGKFLFWDEQVGEDYTMACGTCHRSQAGGSDPRAIDPAAHLPGPDGILDNPTTSASDDIRGAQGVVACTIAPTFVRTGTEVQVTGRKPPTYLDAMFAPDIFWDGRAGKNFTDPAPLAGLPTLHTATTNSNTGRVHGYGLESQTLGPPMSDVEMACAGRTWQNLFARLQTAQPGGIARSLTQEMKDFAAAYNTYPKMFAAAFGATLKSTTGPDEEINATRFAFAIATHERRLTSDQTPWDRWNAGDDDALTPRQVQGFELFMSKGKCNTCHAPPLFTDTTYHFIGFHQPSWDPGRNAQDPTAVVGAMKTPTLRNVGLREAGGLLHRGDGPGRDLPTIMQLYKQGGLIGNTEGVTIDAQITVLDLTQTEIDAIIDFLRVGLTDPRVKNATTPFDRPTLCSEDDACTLVPTTPPTR